MKQNNKCGRYILHVTISTSPSVASIAESSFFKLVYRTLSSSGSAADVIVGDLEIVGLVRKRRSWSGWRDLSNVAGRGPLVMGSNTGCATKG